MQYGLFIDRRTIVKTAYFVVYVYKQKHYFRDKGKWNITKYIVDTSDIVSVR